MAKAREPLGDRLAARRLARWLLSEPIRDRQAGFACSQRYCNARRNLRFTSSGPFCEDHYRTLPPCMEPGCEEPVVEGGRCRNHWMESLPPLEMDAYANSGRCALGEAAGDHESE